MHLYIFWLCEKMLLWSFQKVLKKLTHCISFFRANYPFKITKALCLFDIFSFNIFSFLFFPFSFVKKLVYYFLIRILLLNCILVLVFSFILKFPSYFMKRSFFLLSKLSVYFIWIVCLFVRCLLVFCLLVCLFVCLTLQIFCSSGRNFVKSISKEGKWNYIIVSRPFWD